jgi:RNA polymerase sigma-70 factor, ECF subfamily
MTITSPVQAAETAVEPIEAPPAEAELVRETLEGRTEAFEQIVHMHSARIFNFIHQMTRQAQDAEDLTQQTFIKAYQNLHRFDCTRPFAAWLFTIARRTALNHFRAARHWEAMPEEAASEEPSPARQTENRDNVNSLWERARRILSPREFEVMWLRFAEELSVEETAKVMGLTRPHVKILVFRARHQLMKGKLAS